MPITWFGGFCSVLILLSMGANASVFNSTPKPPSPCKMLLPVAYYYVFKC